MLYTISMIVIQFHSLLNINTQMECVEFAQRQSSSSSVNAEDIFYNIRVDIIAIICP
jgi:hypothetical protein